MKAELVPRIYIKCPFCGRGEKRVCHLFGHDIPNHFGPWACDECGKPYRGTVNSETDIDIEAVDEKPDLPAITVLRFDPKNPIYLMLRDTAYQGDLDGKEYLYNEGTCPINVVSNIAAIIDGTDCDPHGIFEYVGSEIVGRDFRFDDRDEFAPVIERITSGNCCLVEDSE